MYNSRIDGLLVSLAYETENLDHFNSFLDKNIPVVFFDRVSENQNFTNIVINNYKAGYDATKHLIEQGCKRIIHVGGSFKRNVYDDRFKGYAQAMADNSIILDPDLVFIGMLNEESGYDIAQKIIKMENRPDGIFASNDTSAVAIICQLKQAGLRIPEDIAVVGFNNDPISRVIEPNLSTIEYPGHEMGEVAANTLINRLNNIQTANLNTVVINHQLIVRQSSFRYKIF
jgi:LacI family transcriptional regulator